MRSAVWSSFLLASCAYAQTTVTICESYLVTGVSTFTEYSTYYVTGNEIGGTRPTTTVGGTSTSLRTSSTLTNGGTTTSRSSTTRTTSGSILLPDDENDPVTPSTPLPTTTATSTIGTTNPTVTSSTFIVVFNVPQAAAGSLSKRAILAYLAFDENNLSILVSSSTQAALFYLADNVLKSGSYFVAVDGEVEPPRFLLQNAQPADPVNVSIINGTVALSGVESYCLLGESLVVIETGEEAPTECLTALPQLLPKTNSTSSTTSVSSSSSTLSTTTATVQGSASNSISPTSSTSSSSSSLTTLTSSISSSSSDSMTASTVTSSALTSSSSASSSSTVSSASTTTSAGEAVVTNKAYIDTILRHHNRHRANHSAPALTWDEEMAATSKKIADTCVYGHVVDTDCPTYPDVACYGQNIGAGYLPSQMGAIISDGFYNGEVNYYTYYGEEPDTSTLHYWGHFSQIVWKGTTSVGCYTTNCTATGLVNIDPASGIRPYFTVCNYREPGNYLDEFADNVIQPLNYPTITVGYQCPNDDACEDQPGGISVDVGVGGA